MTDHLEVMASALSESGRYRVLRKIEPRAVITPPDGTEVRVGVFLDCETTGLDPAADEVIELAMVPFTFGPDGRIFEVMEPYQSFREPVKAISPEITKLTGITSEMVAGHTINAAEVETFIGAAAVIIAHNADFDRRFAECLTTAFATKAWACTANQVEWSEAKSRNLAYLAMEAGFFYERHRALSDCRAGVELLASPLRAAPALAALLAAARKPTWRIWAVGSPFEAKDLLKARGYRWNGEAAPGYPKSWYIDVGDDANEAEYAWLETEVFRHQLKLPVVRISAFDRFSERAGRIAA